MFRRNPFVAFLRSPEQWTMVLCTAAVVLFLQLFGNWNLKDNVFGQLYFFVQLFVWLCMAIGAGVLIHFAFDRLTDRLARSEDPRSGRKPAHPQLFPRH